MPGGFLRQNGDLGDSESLYVVLESNILAAMSNIMESKEEKKPREKRDPRLLLEEAYRSLDELHRVLDRMIARRTI